MLKSSKLEQLLETPKVYIKEGAMLKASESETQTCIKLCSLPQMGSKLDNKKVIAI